MSSLTHAIGGIFQPILKFDRRDPGVLLRTHPELPGRRGAADHRGDGRAHPADGQEHQEHGGHAGARAGDEEAPAEVQGSGEPGAAQRRNDEALQRAQSQPGIRVSPDAIADAVLLHALQRHPGHHQHRRQGRADPYTVTTSGSTPNGPACATQRVRRPPVHLRTTTKMYHDIVAAHGQLHLRRDQLRRQAAVAPLRRRGRTSPTRCWWSAPSACSTCRCPDSTPGTRRRTGQSAGGHAAEIHATHLRFIYLNVAAILNVYFIVSSAIRIGTQEVLFRKGIVAGAPTRPAGQGGAGQGPGRYPGAKADRTSGRSPRPAPSGTAAKAGGAGKTGGQAGTKAGSAGIGHARPEARRPSGGQDPTASRPPATERRAPATGAAPRPTAPTAPGCPRKTSSARARPGRAGAGRPRTGLLRERQADGSARRTRAPPPTD